MPAGAGLAGARGQGAVVRGQGAGGADGQAFQAHRFHVAGQVVDIADAVAVEVVLAGDVAVGVVRLRMRAGRAAGACGL